VKLDETSSGRLEASVPRARLLFGSAGAGNLEAAGGGSVRPGPPDEQDRREIAAKIRAARGDRPPVIAGQDPEDDADALAAQIVTRARELLAALETNAGAGVVSDADAVAFEAVLQVRGRPALKVEERLEPIDNQRHPGCGFWRPFFTEHELQLLQVASAAGAVIVKDRSGKRPWTQGTAWLIAPDLAVTNRHVLFPPPSGVTLASRKTGTPVHARIRTDLQVTIDFAHDNGVARNMVYAIEEIPFVSLPQDPIDVAVIRVRPTPALAAGEPAPLVLAQKMASPGFIYVVGHPGVVANVPEKVMAVFGTPDERKRVSFGEIMQAGAPRPGEVLHDASTVGGYSGGCVLAFGSAEVRALHYYGHPIAGNRAFTAETLRSHTVAGFLRGPQPCA
jgi:hypothetical protein